MDVPYANIKGGTTVLVVALVLVVPVGTAAGQSFQGASDSVVVGPNETYDRVEGVAGTVIVRGTVTGDIAAVAGTIHVTDSGTVGGDIAGTAGTIRIDGAVEGDVSGAAGTLSVGESAVVGGNLDAGAGYLRVDGTIDGDVRAGAETIELGPNANVGGEFRYDAETFTQDPAATVDDGVVRDQSLSTGFEGLTVPMWVGSLYSLLANLLLGIVLLAVFPSFSRRVATHVAERPARSAGVGFVLLIAIPLVLLLVAITIVGIPLSLAGAVAFGIAVWTAAVYGQYAVGTWLLSLADVENRWLALFVGLVGFAVLGAIPILGGLAEFAALLLGLGALAFGLRERYRGRGEAATPSGQQTTLDEAGGEAQTS